MSSERPDQVTPHHLSRKAIIYIRQSSKPQVKENTGSTEHQYGQKDVARRWGWADDAIEVIDDDQGRSGSAPRMNQGFKRMLKLVRDDQVGAIFASDFSRIARNVKDAAELIEEAAIFGVLIVSNNVIQDLSKGASRLTAGLLATVAEYDNEQRRDWLFNGRMAKARKGTTVSTPPVGYVTQSGKWIRDPVQGVRDAVKLVFEVYREQGSIHRTLSYLRGMGFRLPRRYRHLVRWVVPNASAIAFMLRNRAYVGDYVFRRAPHGEAPGALSERPMERSAILGRGNRRRSRQSRALRLSQGVC